MAQEVEELKLRITIDDQASAQLQRVHQQLSQIGSGPTSQGLHQITTKTTEAERAVGKLSREFLGVGGRAMDFAKILGPLPVSIALIAYETVRHMQAMKEWAAQAVQINNAARMAGVGIGAFRNIQDSLKGSGINAQQSAQMMQTLTRTLSEAARPGSAVREGLLRMAGPQFASAMLNSLDTLAKMRDETDRINYLRHQGLNVYANEFARHHDEMRARYSQLLYLQQFGAEQLINQREDLHKLDKTTLDNIAAESKKQDELNKALSEEEATRTRILDIIRASLLSQDTWVAKMATRAEKGVLRSLEESEAGLRQSQKDRAAGVPLSGKLPDVPGVATGFQHGGIVTKPTFGMVGEAGPEAIIPLGQLGADNEKVIKHTESLGENTKQLALLNDEMEKILAPFGGALGGATGSWGGGAGGGGGGGGGYGGGPGGTGTGPDGTTGLTTPAPGAPIGITGAPLGGVMGNMPFGINVPPDKFSELSGLSPAFMRVSAADRAGAAGISTGMSGAGLGGQFTGLKTEAGVWPLTGDAGGGGGTPGTVGKSLLGNFSSAEQEEIKKVAATYGISPEAVAMVTRTESNYGRTPDTPGSQYKGLFQMNSAEGYPGPDRIQQIQAYGRMIADKNYMGKLKSAGIDITKESPARQFAILQGFQFAPNTSGTWLRNFATPTSGTKQSSEVGDKSINAMTAFGERIMGGSQAGPPIAGGGGTSGGAGATGRFGSGVTVSPITGLPAGAGPAVTASASGFGSIKPEVLAEAARIAATGNAGAVADYIRKQGLPVHEFDCADFVAAIMKKGGAGGAIPKNYPAASSFLNVGDTVAGGLAYAQPGDLLTKIHNRNTGALLTPGEGGGHEAIVGPLGVHDGLLDWVQADVAARKQVDVKHPGYYGDFRVSRLRAQPDAGPTASPEASATTPNSTGLWPWPKDGGAPATAAAPQQNADDILKGSRYDTGDAGADRSSIDKMLGKEVKHDVDTSGTITIKHDRRPNRFRASARAPKFKEAATNRQGSMQPAEAGPEQENPADFAMG